MCVGTSLGVKWLRHCALSAGGVGSIRDPELRSQIPHDLAKRNVYKYRKKNKNKMKRPSLFKKTKWKKKNQSMEVKLFREISNIRSERVQ